MKLGAFSVSLNVKDLDKSQEFYRELGFIKVMGEEDQGWVIMRNEGITIGLFKGMFESNILTFNPGWDENAQPLDSFTDIREIQKTLKESGIKIEKEVDEESSGPASLTITDPDGNVILLDQHV